MTSEKMLGIKDHKELEVYQKSMDFVIQIYELTKLFPNEEKYGLSNQMRRAAISIPSNISEGAARKNTKGFIQFLYYALGSCAEIETQVEISRRLEFIKETNKIEQSLKSIIKMLAGLIRSLENKLKK